MIDIEKELSLGGEPFPQNQTLWNFFDYLLVPSLVYEQSYPRTSRYLLMLFFKLI
jgi:sterol O-acyltransferase